MGTQEISENGLELIAGHWLHLWAECIRLRKAAEAEAMPIYCRGIQNRGEFRAVDDPPPMFFVFAQVELVLGDEQNPRWQFAHHVWVKRLSPGDFRHPNLKAKSRSQLFRMRQSLVRQLARAIGDQKKIPVSIREVVAARKEIRGNRVA